jgi:hypothetical protein
MSAPIPDSPPAPGVSNSTVVGNSTFPFGPLPTNPGRSLQVDIIVCSIVTWMIALVFVVLRFYTRCRLKRILGPTDWCIIPALVRYQTMIL